MHGALDRLATPEPPSHGGPEVRSRRLMLIVLGTMTAFAPLSVDMYLPAFPAIQKALATTPGAVQVTLAAFFIAFAGGQIVYGPLTDRFGRKPPLYAGLVLYAVASAACAVTTSIEALIALRFLQGLGACAGPVIARAVINDVFERHEAVRAYAAMMMVSGLAPMLAPILGGYVLLAWDWSAIFWVLTALGIACLISSALLLPETNPADASRPFGLVPVLRVLLGFTRDRTFMSLALASALSIAAMFAFISGSSFVFIEFYGFRANQYSWLFGGNAFFIIMSAQVNARLVGRYGSEKLLRFGRRLQISAGIVLVAAAATGLGGAVGLMIPLFAFSSAIGFIITNSTVLAMAPYKKTGGSASAMIGMMQFVLGAVTAVTMGWFHAHTPLALALAMAICAIAGQVVFLALGRRKR